MFKLRKGCLFVENEFLNGVCRIQKHLLQFLYPQARHIVLADVEMDKLSIDFKCLCQSRCTFTSDLIVAQVQVRQGDITTEALG